MPIALRVTRTLLGVLLALLLGALIAPLAALHPRSAHHGSVTPIQK